MMGEESKNNTSQLNIYLAQVHSLFTEEQKRYSHVVQTLELEIEKLKKKVTTHANILKENDQLKKTISSIQNKLNESSSAIKKCKNERYEMQKKCHNKIKQYTTFIQRCQTQCRCNIKEKYGLELKSLQSTVSLDSPDGDDSKEVNSTLGFSNKNSKSHVFFLSPVKQPKKHMNDIQALVPMTEQYDEPELNLASTPLLVTETERYPGEESMIEVASDDETVWLSSPTLVSVHKNNISSIHNKENSPCVLPQEENIKNKVFKKPLSLSSRHCFDTPEGGTSVKKSLETSADLFSDTSISLISGDQQPPLTKSTTSKNVNSKMLSPVNCSKSKLGTLPGNGLEKTNENSINESKLIKDLVENKKGKVNYKFSEVVRKKDEREQLNGYDCHECRQYYASDNLTDSQLKEVLKRCSRHRHESTPPPDTPEDFWDIGFPSTQECIDRGYINDENCTLPDYAKPRNRSRKRIKYQ